MDRLRSLRASKEASPSKSSLELRWSTPFWGGSEPKVLVAPEFGRAFGFVKDAAAFCGGSVSSRKLCLRQKGSAGCNHVEGEDFDELGVADDTLYACSMIKSQSLTTVYQDLSLNTLGLDTDFVAFLIMFEGSEGPFLPMLLFSFITRNKGTSLSIFEEAMRSQREGFLLPLLTSSRRKAQSLLAETSALSNLDEFISLMSNEAQAVETLMETMENTDHPGGLRGALATCKDTEWSDQLLELWRMIVERVDRLSAEGVIKGATVVELVEDLIRKESTSDAITLALRNRVMAMEATIGVVDEDSNLSLTLWDNVASMVAAKERSEAKLDINLDLILGEF